MRGYFIEAERRSITVAVKCRVAAVTTCCSNSSCCDRMGFFSFSIRRLKYNINLPVLLPSALCNCLAAPSLLMDFLSNTSSSSISEKQPLLLNRPVEGSAPLLCARLRLPLQAFVNRVYVFVFCFFLFFCFVEHVKETAQTKIKVFLVQPLIRAEWEVCVGVEVITLLPCIFLTPKPVFVCFIDHLLTLQLWSCRNLRRGCLI